MRIYEANNKTYRLPNDLTEFQRDFYVHLIDWKWQNLTEKPGYHKSIPYDAILPDHFKKLHYPIYQKVVDRFLNHKRTFPFKSHKFIGHMASSQAACVNLFLQIMEYPDEAAIILSSVKNDLKSIAVDKLDRGFRIEFWDEGSNLLRDHNMAAGTDADIAIAYRDKDDNLNLWLIEHKLTEPEFTKCGGYRSKKRSNIHKCKPITTIYNDPNLCYYHSGCGYTYWNITKKYTDMFPTEKLLNYTSCPFKDGLNQLWRNQLMAIAIENSDLLDLSYKKVYFSVVRHPKNTSLQQSIEQWKDLTNHSDRFFEFTSDIIVEASKQVDNPKIHEWRRWYEELYWLY
ncbi:hypothetical protein ACFLT3_01125 [Chloroflexota bacterium]